MHNIIQDIGHTRRRGGGWAEGRAGIREWCCRTMLELFGSFCFQEGQVDECQYCHTLPLLVGSFCFQRGLFEIAGIFQRGKGWRLA